MAKENPVNKLVDNIIKVHIDYMESIENLDTISIKIIMTNNESWRCSLVEDIFYGQRFFGDAMAQGKDWNRFEIQSTDIKDVRHKCFLMSNNLTEKQFDAILIVEDITCI